MGSETFGKSTESIRNIQPKNINHINGASGLGTNKL